MPRTRGFSTDNSTGQIINYTTPLNSVVLSIPATSSSVSSVANAIGVWTVSRDTTLKSISLVTPANLSATFTFSLSLANSSVSNNNLGRIAFTSKTPASRISTLENCNITLKKNDQVKCYFTASGVVGAAVYLYYI